MKLERKLAQIMGEMRDVNRRYEEATKAGSGDGGRRAAALDGQRKLAKKASDVEDEQFTADVKDARMAKLERRIEAMSKALSEKGASKAKSIGAGLPAEPVASRRKAGAGVKAHPALKAMFRDYTAGEFITAYSAFKGYLSDGIDAELAALGKAKLAEFASFAAAPDRSASLSFVDSTGKATLGATGATGGYVLPNNLVDTVVKPAVQKAVYQNLVTVVNGVAVRGVDQPYRLGAPPRATFQDWGVTKENLNESYGSYTATLATLARIYDVGKQYLRFSAGSAETDVMDELTKAMILGENFYIMAGAGTGSTGTGDPTTGIYTALNASSSFNGYTTSHGSPANNTLLGSLATAFTQGASALAQRNREATAWVVDAVTFWTAIGQGTDQAGFFVSPTGGPTGFGRTASGALTFWNVPVCYDSNLGTNAATKIAIGGEWSAAKLYRGLEFRIDSSDVAGTRWDQNLVGFRGEEEIGFHAGTAVNVGAFQLITTAIA